MEYTVEDWTHGGKINTKFDNTYGMEDNFDITYTVLLEGLKRAGKEKPSQHGGTVELLNQTFRLKPSAYTFVPRVGVNHAIGIFEGLQLIAGYHCPNIFKDFGIYGQFYDGTAAYGAYAFRIANQVQGIVQRLRTDKYTRHAVLQIWRYDLDFNNYELKSKDCPCALSLQFILDHKENLNMIVNVRSQDIWLGLPYDVIQFGMLHDTIAHATGLRLGTMHWNAASLHFYTRDLAAIHNHMNLTREERVEKHKHPELFEYRRKDIGIHAENIINAMSLARNILMAKVDGKNNLNQEHKNYSATENINRFTSQIEDMYFRQYFRKEETNV